MILACFSITVLFPPFSISPASLSLFLPFSFTSPPPAAPPPPFSSLLFFHLEFPGWPRTWDPPASASGSSRSALPSLVLSAILLIPSLGVSPYRTEASAHLTALQKLLSPPLFCLHIWSSVMLSESLSFVECGFGNYSIHLDGSWCRWGEAKLVGVSYPVAGTQ